MNYDRKKKTLSEKSTSYVEMYSNLLNEPDSAFCSGVNTEGNVLLQRSQQKKVPVCHADGWADLSVSLTF